MQGGFRVLLTEAALLPSVVLEIHKLSPYGLALKNPHRELLQKILVPVHTYYKLFSIEMKNLFKWFALNFFPSKIFHVG